MSEYLHYQFQLPRPNSSVRKWPVPGNSGDLLEAVFRPESTGSWHKSTGRNLENFWPEYCFYRPAISRVFLQDTLTFVHLSCRILRDAVAGVFDLSMY
jgi:hypothetical protein